MLAYVNPKIMDFTATATYLVKMVYECSKSNLKIWIISHRLVSFGLHLSFMCACLCVWWVLIYFHQHYCSWRWLFNERFKYKSGKTPNLFTLSCGSRRLVRAVAGNLQSLEINHFSSPFFLMSSALLYYFFVLFVCVLWS